MSDADLQALLRQVLWAGFGLGAVFGAIAQRTHFCTMGAVADIVNIGDWTRMRMWALAIGVAMLGFNAMVALGLVRAANSVYAAPELLWLSHILGGLMFGFGMVLASGCGSKTLVRIGAGNLKAVVVFCVLGIAAFMTMKGVTAVWRVATVDTVQWLIPGGQDLPSIVAKWLGSTAERTALWLGLLVGGGLVAWALARGTSCSSRAATCRARKPCVGCASSSQQPAFAAPTLMTTSSTRSRASWSKRSVARRGRILSAAISIRRLGCATQPSTRRASAQARHAQGLMRD